MPFVVAALVLLLVQHAAWPLPSPDATSIVSVLEGANSTAGRVRLVGRVVDAAPTWADGVRLTVEAESADEEATTGLVSVSLRETSRRWRSGDRLALDSRLRRIRSFGNFGEFDWATYNGRRGVFVTAYAWRDDDVEVLEPRDTFVDALRRRFAEACANAGGQGAEILEALVIGDRTGITRQTSLSVRDAGLAHFLAISGSHMALIVGLTVLLVRRGAGLAPFLLERFDVMRAAAVLGALAVVGYGTVSGGGVSVARSVLMALAAMAALWRGRPGDDLRALGGSAIVLALAMPGVGEEAGFQLSYLAVTGLLVDARRRRATRRAARREDGVEPGAADADSAAIRTFKFLASAARISLVCWMVTSPIVAQNFQRISLVSPLANLLAAPLISAVVVCGISGLVLLPLGSVAGQAAVGLGAFLADLVLEVAAWCASLPGAATTTVAPGAGLVLLLSALALTALAPPWRGRRVVVGALLVLIGLAVASGVHDRYRGDRLDVWFASVGQGDAAVVRRPGGQVWVIDQGSPGRGHLVVGPLLRRAWIGRVDVLVASHVQSDHSGALVEILEEFEVGEVWLPDGPCDNEAAGQIEALARERGVDVRFVSTAGTEVALARLDATSPTPPTPPASTVEVLWPPPGAAACDDNDQSIVLAFSFAGRRVLFTGDVEARAEAGLVHGENVESLKADVLKVPHHGSRTSSSVGFLEAVSPALAVASVGLDNRFHHPAPDIVARYEARAIPLLRTDHHGAVHLAVEADGRVTVETFRPVEEP